MKIVLFTFELCERSEPTIISLVNVGYLISVSLITGQTYFSYVPEVSHSSSSFSAQNSRTGK